jgi:C-terminal processing protease CtpA/Prc
VNNLVALTLLLAPAAPVPVPPIGGTPAGGVNEHQAQQFATLVDALAQQVAAIYVRKLDDTHPERVLLEAAIRGLYDEVGQAVPESVATEIRQVNHSLDRIQLLKKVRIQLGNHPKLAGSQSLFAAMNGFRHATDPICQLASPRVTTYASVDQDFGVGIELEGVTGLRWTQYSVEHGIATGRIGPVGYFGSVPKPEAVTCPAVFPWRVKRVVPGSPAQRAGVKPGDLITHFNGTEITAANMNRLFGEFANPQPVFDPQTGRPVGPTRTLTFQRVGEKTFSPTLTCGTYTPESAFGVIRTADDKWDCLLDRKEKIGYIRIGPIELGLEAKVEQMLADLMRQGCRALILDLRWCPGGYVDPGTQIAGLFLPDNTVIARMEYRNTARAGTSGEIRTPPGGGKYTQLPLVVLIGQETTGGGELIASALRDNDRCVCIGQRTVGRASIQSTLEAGFANLKFRVTTGTSLRPNGKPRQKLPTSQPTDDWGIRPDEGLEVPVTADKSAQLRQMAELHALRPADSTESLDFDDVTTDPYRLAALAYLRKKLADRK